MCELAFKVGDRIVRVSKGFGATSCTCGVSRPEALERALGRIADFTEGLEVPLGHERRSAPMPRFCASGQRGTESL